MIQAYTVENGQMVLRDGIPAAEHLRGAVWIDLLNPTREEEAAVQDALRVEVPTREEMQEIESSSRLYKEEDDLFLTANFLYGMDAGEFGSTAISFVLTSSTLITVRYATPKAFPVFAARCQKAPALLSSPDGVMLHLFEQIVDRLADILEKIGENMDRASTKSFQAARGDMKINQRSAALKAHHPGPGR
jgi:magnesium transporter